MLCTIIYDYKSIFCNDYLIELGPPSTRLVAVVDTNWTKTSGHKLPTFRLVFTPT